MRSHFISLFLLLAIISCSKETSDDTALVKPLNNSHCTTVEKEYFTCSINSKILSVCGDQNLSKNTGKVFYRFGKIGKIELNYPNKETKAINAFTFSHYNRGGGVQNLAMSDDRLIFVNNDVTYEVFQSYYSEGEATGNAYSNGVKLLIPQHGEANKEVELKCTDPATTKDLASIYYSIFTD